MNYPDIYLEGKQARRNALAIIKNPYIGDDEKAWTWAFGWEDQLAEQVDWLKEKLND